MPSGLNARKFMKSFLLAERSDTAKLARDWALIKEWKPGVLSLNSRFSLARC
jgi:hypothetical protein